MPKKLALQQKALHEQLQQVVQAYKEVPKEKLTKSVVNTYRQLVSSVWEQYQKNHLHILQSETEEEYKKGTLYATTQNIYIETISEIDDDIELFKNESFSSSTPLPERDVQYSRDVKLPKIAMPQFDGTYKSWRSFRDLFCSIIHNDKRLSLVQKFHYLKTSVRGEAERLLRQFDITDENYIKAWEFLRRRYDNKRVLVNTQLTLLFNQSPIKTESAQAIKDLLDGTEEALHELRCLGIPTENWDAVLIHFIIKRLPPETHYQWEREQGDKTDIPSYSELTKFLESRFRTLETIQNNRNDKVQHRTNTKSENHGGTLSFLNKTSTCVKCKKNHALYNCKRFKQLPANQRFKFALQHKLCKNCLSSNHKSAFCPSTRNCFKCKGRHHTQIHLDNLKSGIKEDSSSNKSTQDPKERQPTQSSNGSPAKTPGTSGSVQSFFSRNPTRAILSTAKVEVESPAGDTHILRALIDSGSQVSFITEAARRRLNLNKRPASMEITGLGKRHATYIKHQASFKLRSINSSYQTEMTALVIKQITDLIPPREITTTNLHYLQCIKLADPEYYKPGPIDILLGADIYSQIIENGIIRKSPGKPTAQNTLLGWILMGSVPSDNNDSASSFSIQAMSNPGLEEQLRKFWEIEERITKVSHPEDEHCEENYKITHRRLDNGQYEVQLPFREPDGPELGESRPIAIKQYLQLEKRFNKDSKLHTQYKECMQEYLRLGHMKEIPRTQIELEKQKEKIQYYYLPHHAVLKESSSTTKLRVVFNGSSKTSNGKSLNEQLLAGPTIQSTLWAILLRWRKYQFALSADIEKMYRMVQVHPDHQSYQRIIWRNSPDEPIKDYKLTTVTFGLTSAPYLAIRKLHQLSEDEGKNFPLAAQRLLQDFYVDDLLTGAHDITEALEIQCQLMVMLNKGGFNLRKWTANHPHLLKNIPEEHREIKMVLDLSEQNSIKTLGIQCYPAQDEFSFTVQMQAIRSKYTKRIVLSEAASLFDPLGWLAPSIIIAKIFIQKLWLLGRSWDEPLSEALTNEWLQFRTDLPAIKNIRISRWIGFSPSLVGMEIHGFCDASNQAYAAVIYLKTISEQSEINIRLLT